MQSLIKILIALVVALAVGGGAILWYMLLPEPIARPGGGGTTPGGGQGGISTNVTPTGSTIPQQPPQGPLDIPGEYDRLFAKILAERAPFVSATSSSKGEYAALYTLYAEDVATTKKLFPQMKDLSVQIALVDLTDDDVREGIVYNTLMGSCGTAGCPLDIYQKKSGKWSLLFSMYVVGDMGISNTSVSGFRDIFISEHGVVGYQTNVVRYSWAGDTYKPKEVVAVWDGRTFKTE